MADPTPAELDLLEKAAKYLPGANAGNVVLDPRRPFVLREGRGSRVWDVGGNEYIDYAMGSGPMVLGHAHPDVVEAVVEAARKGSTFFATNENAVLLAEEIVKAVPCAELVRFTTSGTDACFQAMRIARSFRKRDKILKFEGGFHGTSDYALMSVFSSRDQLQSFPEAVPNSAGIPAALRETVLIAPYNDAETTAAIIEKHHEELGAVIIEPMQRVLSPAHGFLQAVRDVTAHYQVPLIFDEVVTGFRVAYGGAQELYGITPDLTTLGKILGGGYPLAAVTGRRDIMSVYDQSVADTGSFVPQVGTLNGNPVACAAGLATLAELRKEGAYQRLYTTGRRLREALERLFREAEVPVQVSGSDPIFGLYFTDQPIIDYRDTLKADSARLMRFTTLLMEHGVLKGWPEKFYPSLAHSSEDVDQTIQALTSTIDQLKG